MKYYAKETMKILRILIFALILISIIILIEYKPVYKVSVLGQEIGYINNKEKFEEIVEKEINESADENFAFATIENIPEYELKLLKSSEETDEEEILVALKEDSVKTYTMYAITIDDNIQTYVNTEKEAESIVDSIKEEYKEKIEINLGVKQIYTKEKEETVSEDIALAKIKQENIDVRIRNNKKNSNPTTKKAVVNGIMLSSKPVSGTITSRFGVSSRIRSGDHTGLDIAAPKGTPIVTCGDGKVTFSGTKGSYGKLIIISHGSGVETWYGHCSELLVSEGQKVSGGQKIGLVGSTGNSTGNHLHLEIRINNKPVNPQNYMY